MTAQMEAAKAWALRQVGCGYIYGATGWVCSAARRQQQAKQYPDQAETILGTGAKWDGAVCWDCAQITRGALKQAGVQLPSGATSQWGCSAWARKGTMDTLPEGEPACLYRAKDGKMQHTGLSLGDGSFVHAKGTAWGVLHEALDRYAWTHWASPWAEGGQTTEEAVILTAIGQGTVKAATGSTVRLRETAGGKVLASVPLGTVVEVYAVASGWVQVGCGGQTGWMQAAFVDVTLAGDGLDYGAMLADHEARIKALESKLGGSVG